MSIELDFRARAVAHAPLGALVAQRVALGALPQGSDLPSVVYSTQITYDRAFDGTIADTLATIEAECWGATSSASEAVADALVAAVEHMEAVSACWVVARAPDFDSETALHVTTVRFLWSV